MPIIDPSHPMPSTYLGDGVYAVHDGYHIWLFTEREDGMHRIALEPAVLAALNDYARRAPHQLAAAVTTDHSDDLITPV